MMRDFKNSKDLMVIRNFLSNMKSFPSVQSQLMSLIKTGKFDGVRIGFKEGIKDIVKRNYSKRKSKSSQQQSVQRNQIAFWQKLDDLDSSESSSTFTTSSDAEEQH